MILVSQGPIYMGDYDAVNGKAASGFLVNVTKIGCANSKLAMTLSRNTKNIKESCSGNKLTIAQLETDRSANLALDMSDFDKKMLAYAMAGTLTAVTGATVTGETFPTVAVGDVVPLKYGLASSIVVKDSAVTPATLVSGTDYTVESDKNGLIGIVNIGTYTQPFKADYSYAAQPNIAAFNKTGVEKGIIFSGINTQDGKRYRAIIPRAQLTLDGDFNFLTTEETTLSLKGEMLYVDGFANDTIWGPFARVHGEALAAA